MLDSPRAITALVVHQWLGEWDDVSFSTEERRRKPKPLFYLFAMSAERLRTLSSIYRRRAEGPRALDTAIQRAHDPRRSQEIARFVRGGFPWSDLSDRQKRSRQYRDLRMPGWLPTAIVANILAPGTKRRALRIKDEDVIRIEPAGEATARLILPEGVDSDTWDPEVAPIEIIDGQHRLWAFDGAEPIEGDYELPVVAFHDLDITWQAYLFYTINIKPKRINPSLAFDLYPILRIQDWLERSPAGAAIYRETRAQELTEVLWSHPESPWQGRINMLGERRGGSVTQAAFIRSLMASYVKRWEGRGVSIGGLFGSELHPTSDDVLQWNRSQQAAFLICVWQAIANAVRNCRYPWAEGLRSISAQGSPASKGSTSDPAAVSGHSLLANDQGVRGVLHVTNDLCYVAAGRLGLADWTWYAGIEEGTVSEGAVSDALASLRQQPVCRFLSQIAGTLAEFDWRTSSTPGLPEEVRTKQLVFRGGSGYRELRRRLMQQLLSSEDAAVSSAADEVWRRLGY